MVGFRNCHRLNTVAAVTEAFFGGLGFAARLELQDSEALTEGNTGPVHGLVFFERRWLFVHVPSIADAILMAIPVEQVGDPRIPEAD